MKLIIPLLICTLFCTEFCCTPRITASKIERVRAKADSVLSRTPEEQARVDQEKKYHRVGVKVSVIVLAVWIVAYENLKDKD